VLGITAKRIFCFLKQKEQTNDRHSEKRQKTEEENDKATPSFE
jgi:hypothetical protein